MTLIQSTNSVQAIAFVDHAIQASPYFRSVSSVFISGEISGFLIRAHPR
jgi:hypothetical protein